MRGVIVVIVRMGMMMPVPMIVFVTVPMRVMMLMVVIMAVRMLIVVFQMDIKLHSVDAILFLPASVQMVAFNLQFRQFALQMPGIHTQIN